MKNDISTFITTYSSLREVEKKALQNVGTPITPCSIRTTTAKAMLRKFSSPSNNKTTSRYGGGAKEEALQILQTNNNDLTTLTQTQQDLILGVACAWCAKPLPETSTQKSSGVSSTYCSQKCAEEGRLRRGGMYASTRVRAQLFALEGGICKKCGLDAHALYKRINSLQPPERLNALINANWNLRKSAGALERLLQRPKEGDFWQADHVVAVAEGGGDCGLENLRTLCTPCHLGETERLRGRMRLSGIGGGSETDGAKRGGTQRDIREAFSLSQKLRKRRRSAD